ncbi:MAG: hypothetical protein ACRDIU_09390, partial [Actinomycetota bacterium]
ALSKGTGRLVPAPAGRPHRPAIPGALVALAILVAATAAMGPAWACVPVRSIVQVEPQSSGPPGVTVKVSGVGFGDAPVEIRWNDLNGPKLADTNGPIFSADVKIPESKPGLYTLIALTRAKDAGVDNAGTAPFFVTGPGSELKDLSAQALWSSRAPATKNEPSRGSWILAAGLLAIGLLVGFAGAQLRSRRRATTSKPVEPAD